MFPHLPRITVLGLGVVVLSSATCAAQTKVEHQEVHVDQIGRSVTLVGRLGKPLGQKTNLRGTWSFPTKLVKDYSARFTITHVDGKRLDTPVEFNLAQITALTPDHKDALPPHDQHRSLDGQQWSMIAYETGEINLTPDEYGKNSAVFPAVQMPYYAEPFTSRIVAIVTAIDGQPVR